MDQLTSGCTRPAGLRHARITYLANKTDIDLNFIRMLAGHEQIETTLEYVDNDWDEARNAYHTVTGTP